MEEEIWKEVPGYNGKYHVSNMGRIKSLHKKAPKILSSRLTTNGYPGLKLCKNGKINTVLIHRVMLITFYGERPPHLECRHLNSVRNDNRLSNLRWGTKKENGQDKVMAGNSVGHGKLTPKDVVEIRYIKKWGLSNKIVGEAYGVSYDCISNVHLRKRWRHIK